MSADILNEKYTGQKPTKEVLGDEIEVDFTAIKKRISSKIIYIQLAPSLRPYAILRGEHKCVSGLYMPHIQFSITSGDKYQVQ